MLGHPWCGISDVMPKVLGAKLLRIWRQQLPAVRTQSAVARALRVSEQSIYLIESGKRRPSLDVAVAIEQLTGIEVRAFAIPLNPPEIPRPLPPPATSSPPAPAEGEVR